MLLMLWLVLCTGVNLIIIPKVLMVFLGVVWLIFDVGFIVKFWEIMDAKGASIRPYKEF